MQRTILIALVGFCTACQSISEIPTAAPPSKSVTAAQTEVVSPTIRAIQSNTPPPTFTPVPFFFTEEFETDLTPWVSFQTGGIASPNLDLENGHLRLDLSSPNTWFYAIHDVHDYQDVQITAKFTGIPSGALGLICRYSDRGWFEYLIASDGTYSALFAQWLGEGIAQYTPIRTDSSEYLRPGDLAYEIGLTCQGNFLLLHVNGKLFRKIDITRFALTSGRIGVSFASFEETPMIATFDWVRVDPPAQ